MDVKIVYGCSYTPVNNVCLSLHQFLQNPYLRDDIFLDNCLTGFHQNNSKSLENEVKINLLNYIVKYTLDVNYMFRSKLFLAIASLDTIIGEKYTMYCTV